MTLRIRRLAVPTVLLVLTACPSDDGPPSDDGADTTAGDVPPDFEGQAPHRDAWRVVHEGPFVAFDEEGAPAILELVVGSTLGHQDNFVNRGDVIVQLDAAPGTIAIELRRFTFATSQAEAQDIYDRLHLWAYSGSTAAPKRPADMDAALRCDGVDEDGLARPWRDGCAIYVYYEGQTQLARSGADIRVHLPPEYRGALSIATSDNVLEDTYPNRGNVCVDSFAGALDVELQNGIARVSTDATSAYPTCPADLVAACEAFDDPLTDGPDAWSADCPCIAQGYSPGIVKVASLAPSSADITVDVPAGLWTNFRAENTGNNLLDGQHCPVSLEGLAAVDFTDGASDPARPWARAGTTNRPAQAPAGGFRIDLESSGCEAVSGVESPAEWDPDVEDPDPTLRGTIEICEGCLVGTSCDDLLPG